MKTQLFAVAAASAALAMASPASAAFIFSEGNIGGTGVHSSNDMDQTGLIVYGTVGVGGELVTFSSTDTLHLNGSGEATIDADPLNNLLVQFISNYSVVGWNVELPGGKKPAGGYTMNVSVNVAAPQGSTTSR